MRRGGTEDLGSAGGRQSEAPENPPPFLIILLPALFWGVWGLDSPTLSYLQARLASFLFT